jgi:pimeloyl-ACP methyl ester carboxylesterase
MKPIRILLAASLVVLLAGSALAAPVIGPIETKLKKSKKLSFKVEVTLDAPGEVRLVGDLNGQPVSVTKRFRKPATKRLKLKVNARKFGYRKLVEDLDFDLRIEAVEESGAIESRDVSRVVPVPLVYLHGLGGDETSLASFKTALDLAMPGRYDDEGEKPNLVLHGYDSINRSLPTLGGELDAVVGKLLKTSGFKKVDIVAHSMGGLVTRTFLTRNGASGKVRKFVMLSTPNEGVPLAYLATLATDFVVPATLPEEAQDLADLLLDANSKAALRNFYPDYDWLAVPPLLEFLLPDMTSPLTDLNRIDPPADVDVHVFSYSSTGQEVGDLFGLSVGTVEALDLMNVDLLSLLSGGSLDIGDLPLDALVLGDGDGLVPYRSAVMTDIAAWAAAITAHDMGIGFHGAMPVDPRMWAELDEILRD